MPEVLDLGGARLRRADGRLLFRVELTLALRQRALPLLDRLSLELDCTELASPPVDLGLFRAQTRFPLEELTAELLELQLAVREVASAEAKQALDGGSHVAQELLSPFEVGHRLLEAARLLLELAAPRCQQLLEPLLGARVGEHAACQIGLGGRFAGRVLPVSVAPRDQGHRASVASLRGCRESETDPPETPLLRRRGDVRGAERGSRTCVREPISRPWTQKAHDSLRRGFVLVSGWACG